MSIYLRNIWNVESIDYKIALLGTMRDKLICLGTSFQFRRELSTSLLSAVPACRTLHLIHTPPRDFANARHLIDLRIRAVNESDVIDHADEYSAQGNVKAIELARTCR
jgi:hypothetical protein